MIRAKGFCLFALAALILPQCNIGLEQRTITTPCALEVGPTFRCISPKNCGPNLMQNLTEIVICGPNGIGICCPVISFRSQAGCGIRVRSIAAPPQDLRYPNVPDAARQVVFTSFTQSMHGQRMLGQGDIQVDSLGIINRNPKNTSGEMNENSTLEEHGNDEELLTPPDSDPEIHYEAPLVQVSLQDTRRRKSASVHERRLKREITLTDRKPQIGIVWSFPQNVSKWNKQTSDSFQKEMEDYMNMAKEIEKLILQVGGMGTICREYPELAQILTVELNKNCPQDQSSNITSSADWKFIGEKEKSSSLKGQGRSFEAKSGSNLARNRREAKEDEKNWEELYYLSREYLRKLLLIMISEKPGEPLSYENIAKIPLYPPFSPRQLRAIIVRDPTIIDRSAALEITKDSRMTYSKDSITNGAIGSSQSLHDFSFKNNPIGSSIKNNVSEAIEGGSVSQAVVQFERESEVKGTVDEKILDGSKVWDLRLEMAPTNNKQDASEHLNSDVQVVQNSKQVWRTGNRRNIPLEGVKLVNGEERHEVILNSEDQGSKIKVQKQEIDENEEEKGPPLHVFHVKVDHKTDYSKMLKTDEAVDFEKGRTLKDLMEFRSSKSKNLKIGEQSKVDLKGEGKIAGNENLSLRMREKTVENKNDHVQLRADGKLRQEFLQSPIMAKDTTEAWIHNREEGEINEKAGISGSAIDIENSRQNREKILPHQASEHRELSGGKVFPETIVESYKLMKANIPHTLDGTDFKIDKENRSDVDFVFHSKGRSAKEKGEGKLRFRSNGEEVEDIIETAITPDESPEFLLKNTAPPLAIHTNESAELLFNLRNDSAESKGNINFGQSKMLSNNNAGQFKVGNSEENKEIRETIFKPTNSQQITEETKTRFSNGTMGIMHDSSQSKDLEDISIGKITNQTLDSEDAKDAIEFAKKISELNAAEMEFNRKTHEGPIAGQFKLSMEHSVHANGENSKIDSYEPSVLFSVESQYHLHATEKSLLNHQIDESQKSIFETGSLIESMNNQAGMQGIRIHVDDQSRLDKKLRASSSDFHDNHKIEEEISIPGLQNNPLNLSKSSDIDMLVKASIELTTDGSNIRNSFGPLNMEAASDVLIQSEGKAASELEERLAKHLKDEMVLDSNLSLHSNETSDTGVQLNAGATEAEKNATLFIVGKESNPSKVSMEGGSFIHEMGMEAKDILSNVKDSFNVGPKLNFSNQKELNVSSDSESLLPVAMAFNDSQRVAISQGLKKGIFNTGSRGFKLGIRVKRELGEPEPSSPYHIFFHDIEPLSQPQPFENQINPYDQPKATITSAKRNASSDNNSNVIQQTITKNNSNISQQTEVKSKIIEKDSASRGIVNLKHKGMNYLTNLVTTSDFTKDTKRKNSKGAVNKTHKKKKGKRYNKHHKNGVTKSKKFKNNYPSHSKTNQKETGNEQNKHKIPSKNTSRRHHKGKQMKQKANHKGKQMEHKTSHKGKKKGLKTNHKGKQMENITNHKGKQMKHKTNHKKTHRKNHRHARNLLSWPTTSAESENPHREYQYNLQATEKPKKTLNLRILYGKEETPYKPPEINPFSDYNMPSEEDEFEKIVHLGYRKHLFNKGRFSVLHLTKNFKVYKPGEKESSEEDEDAVIGYRNGTNKQSPQFVIGGRNVEAPWPWVVGIYDMNSMKFVCGGTLFDSQHIVSAAHCFARYKNQPRFGVVIGSQYRWDKRPTQAEKLHPVKQLFVHEGFTMACYCNDLAILRLEQPLSSFVPACIPHYDPAGVGENATVLGWGDTSFHSEKRKFGVGTEMLQRVDDLIIYPKEQCRNIMSRIARRNLPENFGEYYICAGVPDGTKDACIGDSGGPLLHEDYDGVWSIIGVVSFGYKCAEPGVPGTYSRISYYLPWINKILETP